MELKVVSNSHQDPKLVENRKHQFRTVNTMVFAGSAFKTYTKIMQFLHEKLVWTTFEADVAPGAVKIGARCAPSGPSDALRHETVVQRGPKRDVLF